MKKIIALCCIFLSVLTSYAQYNKLSTDSLKVLLRTEKSDSLKVKLLLNMGTRFGYGHKRDDSVLQYLQQALEIANKKHFIRFAIIARTEIGRYFYTTGNYAASLQSLLQNLDLAEQNKDTVLILQNIKDLMKAYFAMGDYEQQLLYAQKTKALLEQLTAKDSVLTSQFAATYLNHMAKVNQGLGNNDSALFYYKKADAHYKAIGDAQGIAVGLNSLAGIYAKMNNTDSSFALFKKSIPYAVASKRFDIVSDSKLKIAMHYHKMGLKDSAFNYAREALFEVQAMMEPDNALTAYLFIAKLYQEQQQFDSAYKYLQLTLVMKDSLQNLSNITQAQSFSFNVAMQQQKLVQEKKEAEQQYRNKIKLYALVAIIAVFIIIAVLLNRNVRNKRKANTLLSRQKEEILDVLTNLKSTQSQLIQSEKMASLGELTAGIAHEIQNPLNFVNNFSEVSTELVDEMNDEIEKGNLEDARQIAQDLKQNLEKINHHGKRAGEIVKGMLQHSRSSSGVKEPTDINALCDEYLRLSYHGLRAKDKSFNATMKTNFDESIGKINIIPQDIGRVVLNLLTNAFYVVDEKKKNGPLTPEGGTGFEPTVTISTKRTSSPLGAGGIQISVTDNGNGIPQKVLDKIFQPFFTTKPTGQGTGLGLSLSYDIVKAHGGELKVETKEGEGTNLIIVLPNTG